MKQVYFTLTGTCYYYGTEFLEKDMTVCLEKEKDNEYDTEAICVRLPGFGKIGHVANSVRTRLGESWSAGRLYDRIGDTAEAKIMYIMPKGVLCRIDLEEEA